MSAAALPVALVVGLLSRDGELLRLGAVGGTLLGAALHHLNWALYRRSRSPEPDSRPTTAAR